MNKTNRRFEVVANTVFSRVHETGAEMQRLFSSLIVLALAALLSGFGTTSVLAQPKLPEPIPIENLRPPFKSPPWMRDYGFRDNNAIFGCDRSACPDNPMVIYSKTIDESHERRAAQILSGSLANKTFDRRNGLNEQQTNIPPSWIRFHISISECYEERILKYEDKPYYIERTYYKGNKAMSITSMSDNLELAEENLTTAVKGLPATW